MIKKKFIKKMHASPVLSRIVHTLRYCLQRELMDCSSVLDLGCGPSSPLQYCKNITYSVGIEAFVPYLEISKKKKIHSKYLNKKIENIDFPDDSFDAVIMIEVLEHLSKEEGEQILKNVEKWAKKKVIVSSPNGFIPQKEVDNNPYQKHLSGWNLKKMKNFGFKIKGLAGLKFLRQEVENDTMGNDLTTSIRFKPKLFWFVVASLSQIITYFFAQLAFELFCVKNWNKQ